MTAEVGRENSYQDKYLFGGHSDSANNEYNLGMFSWQKERSKNVYNRLKSAGYVANGKMQKTQENLNEQVQFTVHRVYPSYASQKFHNYQQFSSVLIVVAHKSLLSCRRVMIQSGKMYQIED